jgi:hypothetical protein
VNFHTNIVKGTLKEELLMNSNQCSSFPIKEIGWIF